MLEISQPVAVVFAALLTLFGGVMAALLTGRVNLRSVEMNTQAALIKDLLQRVQNLESTLKEGEKRERDLLEKYHEMAAKYLTLEKEQERQKQELIKAQEGEERWKISYETLAIKYLAMKDAFEKYAIKCGHNFADVLAGIVIKGGNKITEHSSPHISIDDEVLRISQASELSPPTDEIQETLDRITHDEIVSEKAQMRRARRSTPGHKE